MKQNSPEPEGTDWSHSIAKRHCSHGAPSDCNISVDYQPKGVILGIKPTTRGNTITLHCPAVGSLPIGVGLCTRFRGKNISPRLTRSRRLSIF